MTNATIELATELMILGKDRLAQQIIRSHAEAKVSRLMTAETRRAKALRTSLPRAAETGARYAGRRGKS